MSAEKFLHNRAFYLDHTIPFDPGRYAFCTRSSFQLPLCDLREYHQLVSLSSDQCDSFRREVAYRIAPLALSALDFNASDGSVYVPTAQELELLSYGILGEISMSEFKLLKFFAVNYLEALSTILRVEEDEYYFRTLGIDFKELLKELEVSGKLFSELVRRIMDSRNTIICGDWLFVRLAKESSNSFKELVYDKIQKVFEIVTKSLNGQKFAFTWLLDTNMIRRYARGADNAFALRVKNSKHNKDFVSGFTRPATTSSYRLVAKSGSKFRLIPRGSTNSDLKTTSSSLRVLSSTHTHDGSEFLVLHAESKQRRNDLLQRITTPVARDLSINLSDRKLKLDSITEFLISLHTKAKCFDSLLATNLAESNE